MDLVWGTNKSLAICHLCNLGIAMQLYKSNDKINVETVAASIIVGLYLADLNSGLVHILFDTYDGDIPFLKIVANDFTRHHKNPKKIVRDKTLQLLQETAIVPYNLSCLLYNTFPYTSNAQMVAQLSFLLSSNLIQIIHQSAHFVNHASTKEKRQFKYRIVKLLQDNHIIVKSEIHRKHHQTYDTNFCLLTGWANPLLNYIYLLGNTAKQTNNKI